MNRQLTHDDVETVMYALARLHTDFPMESMFRKDVECLFDMFKKIKDDGDICEIQSYSVRKP